MGVLRLAITFIGVIAGMSVIVQLLIERRYPAPRSARFLVPIVVAGAAGLAHLALFLVNGDTSWLFAYMMAFGTWALLAIPGATAFYAFRTRKIRRALTAGHAPTGSDEETP